MKGYEFNIEMFFIIDGFIFVLYGCWEEENVIKFWLIESLECIVLFKLDCMVSIIFMFLGLKLFIRIIIYFKILEMIF